MGCYSLTYQPRPHVSREFFADIKNTLSKKETLQKKSIDYFTGGSIITERSWSATEYRYGGAGGQEMDNEISGKGNSYTAEYWQYDSRLMRRWNVDPVYKHYQSSYSTFSNNPILRIDPNGADDFFDKDGNYLGRVGKGSAIKIIDDRRCFEAINSAKISTAKKLKSLNEHNPQSFKEFYFNKSNLSAASKIITHYYKNSFSADKLHNGKISIMVNDRLTSTGGSIQYNDGVRGLASASAWTTHNDDGTYTITVKFLGSESDKKGHYSLYEDIDNGSDLTILLRHEEYHGRNHRDIDTEGNDKALVEHLDTYHYSMSSGDDWANASDGFKESYRSSIVDYLNGIENNDTRKAQLKRFDSYLTDKNKKSIKTE